MVHVAESVLDGRAAMVRAQLDERQWSKVAAILEAQRGAGRRGKDDRNFIEAVLGWRRTGVPWRDLPEAFGYLPRCKRISTTNGIASTARPTVRINTRQAQRGG